MTPDSDPPWDHPDPFVTEVTALPGDVDSYGHVNNAVYLKWLERCAWAHSASVGLPEPVCLRMARGMAVRSVRLDYLAAAHAGDVVLVGNWITRGDRLRVTRRFQLIRRAGGPRPSATLLRGEIDYFCLNLESGKPTRMPPEFVRGYAVTLAP